jgi:hypothetical protein
MRTAQAEERARTAREQVGLNRDVAIANAARANAQLGLQQGQFAESQRQARRKDLDANVANRAAQIAGDPQRSTLFGFALPGGTESAEQLKGRTARIQADITSNIEATLAAHRMGDLGSQKQETVEALYNLDTIRRRMEQGRTEGDRSLKEFFGVNRFDSRDMASYMPVEARRRALGGYDIVLRNGNVVEDVRARGGAFNLGSANTPIDADIAALITPLIEKLEKRR